MIAVGQGKGDGSSEGSCDANNKGHDPNQGDVGGRAAYDRLVAEARGSIVELSPRSLRNWLKQGAVLIDVREPDEFASGHLEGAMRIDRAELGLVIDQLVPDLATPIACCCSRGNRSALVAYQLQQLGYGRVGSLRDGLERWDQKKSLQRSRESGAESLEQAEPAPIEVMEQGP